MNQITDTSQSEEEQVKKLDKNADTLQTSEQSDNDEYDEEGDMVADLQAGATNQKKKDRRASSKIFSLAKNNRMASFYKYDEIKSWTFDEIFKFESAEK